MIVAIYIGYRISAKSPLFPMVVNATSDPSLAIS
jgi:hypothetical protein